RSEGSSCTVMTTELDDPAGHDRVLRNRYGQVIGIARDLDLVGNEVSITEVPMGVYCIRRGVLAPGVRRVPVDPIDGSYQLIDLLGVLSETGHRVHSFPIDDVASLTPVDNRHQLAEAEAELRRRTNRRWLDRGVTMIDPDRTYLDVIVQLGVDVTLFPGTILQGSTVIGDGCEIGPDVRLDRCRVGAESVVEQTVARLASIGSNCRVGPYAALDPGADIPDSTITGPFFRA
ncbi:MAG: bifunctional UDP-N-acetylglucosamine diphosphorylase/glucosamine-1-phosphate N-acetyltransferase GlmU, partial [Actinomycetota bacterium]|nr:bifunctional UDP-N-acetylglucosamine diphosphorylase/glucosamine-1-phosphate N-acetyltransferase GlmU [Actinomycetota bacterium]